jgi:hypothetical protein
MQGFKKNRNGCVWVFLLWFLHNPSLQLCDSLCSFDVDLTKDYDVWKVISNSLTILHTFQVLLYMTSLNLLFLKVLSFVCWVCECLQKNSNGIKGVQIYLECHLQHLLLPFGEGDWKHSWLLMKCMQFNCC